MCVVILLPKPPPMSCVTKRSLSSGDAQRRPIQIAATPGIWWLQWIVHCRVPRSYSTSAAEHSSGVEEKRSKCSSSIRITRSAAFSAPSTSPQSNMPDQTTFVPASSCRIGAPSSCALRASTTTSQRLVLDLDQVGGVAGELAGLGDDGDDRLADVPHLADGERVVLDLVARARSSARRTGRSARPPRRRQRPVDALERLRLRRRRPRRSARARTASGRSGRSPCRARLTSSAKTPSPWTSRLSSLRGIDLPAVADLELDLLGDGRASRSLALRPPAWIALTMFT